MRRARMAPIMLLAGGLFVAASITLLPSSAQTEGSQSAKHHAPFYGVGISRGISHAEYRQMQRGGVRLARMNFDWRTAQPTLNGTYDWKLFDRQVGNLAKRGIEVVAQVFGTPGWLAPNFAQAPVFSKAARRTWRQYVHAAVNRYGRNGTFWVDHPTIPYQPIKDWEVWNEENSPGFFQPKPSPHQYKKLLKDSARSIRQADPKAQVVLGGMFESTGKHGAILSWKFLSRLYKVNAEKYFDAIGVHPYSPVFSGFRYQLQRMSRALHNHHDGGTPILVDEIAWGSGHGASPQNMGRHGQAVMLHRAFRYVVRHRNALNIKLLMWYPFRDSTNTPEGCIFCKSVGLFDRGGHPKPSWHRFREFADR